MTGDAFVARDSRAGRAPTGGMAQVVRRSGSHPRTAPEPPAIADKVRSYGVQLHRMALSEAPQPAQGKP